MGSFTVYCFMTTKDLILFYAMYITRFHCYYNYVVGNMKTTIYKIAARKDSNLLDFVMICKNNPFSQT